MGPFALSIPGYRLGVHRHKQQHRSGATQRREDASQSPSPPPADTGRGTRSSSTTASRLPSDSINPLSHSPDTLHQLAVAGLSPDDDLPSRLHRGFPHRPLPTSKTRRHKRSRNDRRSIGEKKTSSSSPAVLDSSDGDSDETDATTISRRGGTDNDDNDGDNGGEGGAEQYHHSSARMRHLNTMTAIMHRCLADGDVARAKRALGLLLRTRDVDLRANNLWAVGLEILMREGEEEVVIPEPAKYVLSSASSDEEDDFTRARPYASSSSSSSFGKTDDEDADPDEAAGDNEKTGKENDESEAPPPPRWGSATNTARAQVYLEALAREHPHDVRRPQLTSAADFWPALFSLECHNLDVEFRRALHQIHIEYGGGRGGRPSSSSSSASHPRSSRSPPPDGMGYTNDDYYHYGVDRMDIDVEGHHDKYSRRRERRPLEEEEEQQQHRHAATDALRKTTQQGYIALASRLDAVLSETPYRTHSELLRLRGHIALCVGDLYLPSRLVDRYHTTYTKTTAGARRGALRKVLRDPGDSIAAVRRRAEREKAMAFFGRALDAGARLEGWVLRILRGEDEDEDEGDGDGEGEEY